MTTLASTNKNDWERAEIERSAFEADHTPDAKLVADRANVARYLAPKPTTVYPLEYAYALLGDITGKLVLDFGCGSGENTLLLARRGANVLGVDISESLIRVAMKRLKVNGLAGAADFVAGSAHDLPVKSGSVDIVLGIAILHHLDLDASSREIHRVLKPAGRAIFQEPVRNSQLIKAVRRAIPYQAPDVSPYERPLTNEELNRFAAPFGRQRVRAFSLPFVNLAQAVPALRRYIHGAYRLDGAMLRRMPALNHYAGIRVIEVVK
jgi:2-polyprenyl-3-methyl-5-hydroxy-6-metoxy-1,4-benzoquinol methylase